MLTGVRLAVAVMVGTRVAIVGSLGSLIGVRVGFRVDEGGTDVATQVGRSRAGAWVGVDWQAGSMARAQSTITVRIHEALLSPSVPVLLV